MISHHHSRRMINVVAVVAAAAAVVVLPQLPPVALPLLLELLLVLVAHPQLAADGRRNLGQGHGRRPMMMTVIVILDAIDVTDPLSAAGDVRGRGYRHWRLLGILTDVILTLT